MSDINQVMITQLEKYMDTRFNAMEKKIDEQEERTRLEIERFRANLENMFNVKMTINSNDHSELWQEVKAIKSEIKELKEKEAKTLIDAKNGFLKGGADIATKAVWTVFFGFVGFLIWNYIQSGGLIK